MGKSLLSRHKTLGLTSGWRGIKTLTSFLSFPLLKAEMKGRRKGHLCML